jgi:hypothetical protein
MISPAILAKAVALWLLLAVLAVLNGSLRQFLLVPELGPVAGLGLSGLLFAAGILLVTWLTLPWYGPLRSYQYWLIGCVWLGPVNANCAPALLRESDGCKARRAGKGLPLPSGATQQTRFLAATLRDGPTGAHPFVASCLQWPALLRVSLRGLHPESASSQA